ncbi:hypothetical protein KM043_016416 [Ampulex compressa]|nr:hypothetical protein KM043_016416 [Ampulex compressa]
MRREDPEIFSKGAITERVPIGGSLSLRKRQRRHAIFLSHALGYQYVTKSKTKKWDMLKKKMHVFERLSAPMQSHSYSFQAWRCTVKRRIDMQPLSLRSLQRLFRFDFSPRRVPSKFSPTHLSPRISERRFPQGYHEPQRSVEYGKRRKVPVNDFAFIYDVVLPVLERHSLDFGVVCVCVGADARVEHPLSSAPPGRFTLDHARTDLSIVRAALGFGCELGTWGVSACFEIEPLAVALNGLGYAC